MSHYFYRWQCQGCNKVAAVLQLEPGEGCKIAGFHMHDAMAYCPQCIKGSSVAHVIGSEMWFRYMDACAWVLKPYIELLLDPRKGKVSQKLLNLGLTNKQIGKIKPAIGSIMELNGKTNGEVVTEDKDKAILEAMGFAGMAWRESVANLVPSGTDPILSFKDMEWCRPVEVALYQSILRDNGFNVHTGHIAALGSMEKSFAKQNIEGWPDAYLLPKDDIWYERWNPERMNNWQLVEPVVSQIMQALQDK